MSERILTSTKKDEEVKIDISLRPKSFDEFPGQDIIKNKLLVYVSAAKSRGEALDHTLLSGPPGLGKTTLAYILAEQMGVEIKTTSGPTLEKKGDLAALLTSLKPKSILFIDEIHRMNKIIEEYLYSAMEDFFLEFITGDGLGARTMKYKLPPFTLIGATTRTGLLNSPFLDRFGIAERLQFYDVDSLLKIVLRSAKILKIQIDPEGAMEIAKRCRKTPRIANRLLKRVRDFAQVKGTGLIDKSIAISSLKELGVDELGIDEMDRQLLRIICEKFEGGPVGIETICACLSEEKDTVEDVYEPFLLQEGLLIKTPRGRIASKKAFEHLKIKQPKKSQQELEF